MNLNGFNSFLSAVPDDTVFVMESTGRYHKNLCHFLIDKSFSVCIENSMMIKNYVKSTTLRKTKTDRADALSIARYGLANYDRLRREKHAMDDEGEEHRKKKTGSCRGHRQGKDTAQERPCPRLA